MEPCWPHQSPAAAWHAATHCYQSRPAEGKQHAYIQLVSAPQKQRSTPCQGGMPDTTQQHQPFDCQTSSHEQCSTSQASKQQQQPGDATPYTCMRLLLQQGHPQNIKQTPRKKLKQLLLSPIHPGSPRFKEQSVSPAEAYASKALLKAKHTCRCSQAAGNQSCPGVESWARSTPQPKISKDLAQHSSAGSIRRFNCHICAFLKPSANPLPSRARAFQTQGLELHCRRKEQPQAQHQYNPVHHAHTNTPDHTLLKQGVGKTTAQLAAWGNPVRESSTWAVAALFSRMCCNVAMHG